MRSMVEGYFSGRGYPSTTFQVVPLPIMLMERKRRNQ
jgi:hypothetical protein